MQFRAKGASKTRRGKTPKIQNAKQGIDG